MEEYTVLTVLGEGSFGRVLLVGHRKNKSQKYAMKEIRLPKSDTKKSWNESILLAKMKHPNIVTYRESFEVDGHLYIVMEYCDDGDLMQKIKHQKGKLFPEEVILNWFAQICLAVKYIHDKRVLHRDIKAKNIFLTQHRKVKLGDFGSALLLTSPEAYACSYVGTPYYVPPEIWENMPYNNKSDIWSLGCILYELCTLKHPFQATSWKHLILKVCKGYYSPLPSCYAYELHYLIKQMFKKNPKNRPSASTILARNRVSKLLSNLASTEEEGNHTRGKSSKSDLAATSRGLGERGLATKGVDEKGKHEVSPEVVFPSPNRRQWEKERSSTTMNFLENASLLSSSITTMENASGCVRTYGKDSPRKAWTKECPETLMNILHNADVSLAFQTYTIHKAASDDLLKGPLTAEIKAPDEADGEIFREDAERLEPRSDEDDTDFEADDDPDWVSELRRITKVE